MITLCVDIGLRHLSMCIMTSDHEILLWDVFNVLDTDNHHCGAILKDGSTVCNKRCSMKYSIDCDIVYTCERHFPKTIKKTKANAFRIKNISEYLLQDIAKAFLKKIDCIYENNKDIFMRLDSVFIELQTQINPKAVFMSHILYGKLVELYKDTLVSIRFVRASQKLKLKNHYTGPELICPLKGAYAERKWLSIQYCKWFLQNKFSVEERDKWLPVFSSFSKADDAADSFLYAIQVIQ